MGQLLLLLVVALTVAAVVFGVAVLVTDGDPGLAPAEPDGTAVPLPGSRPLREGDVADARFDTVLRGYRMAQVDQAMRRAAYDIGYKDELIGVLEAEVTALREGRTADADALRDARVAAASAGGTATGTPEPGTIEPETSGSETSGSDAPVTTAGPLTDATDRPAADAGGHAVDAATGRPAADAGDRTDDPRGVRGETVRSERA